MTVQVAGMTVHRSRAVYNNRSWTKKLNVKLKENLTVNIVEGEEYVVILVVLYYEVSNKDISNNKPWIWSKGKGHWIKISYFLHSASYKDKNIPWENHIILKNCLSPEDTQNLYKSKDHQFTSYF